MLGQLRQALALEPASASRMSPSSIGSAISATVRSLRAAAFSGSRMMLQVALNGSRTAAEHPAIPRTPDGARERRAWFCRRRRRAAAPARLRRRERVARSRAVRRRAARGTRFPPACADLAHVHHGDGVAGWAVNARALHRGHGIRTGLEDTTVLPDGRRAPDNAALVRAAAALMS